MPPTGVSGHQCTQCRRSFTSRSYWKQHMISEHGVDPAAERNHFFHQPSTSGSQNRPGRRPTSASQASSSRFPCTQCGQSYASKYSLKCHLATVHNIGQTRHTCSQCGRHFQSRTLLNNHVQREHRGIALDKKWKCPHCDAAFTQKSNLNCHVRTHHGGSSSSRQ